MHAYILVTTTPIDAKTIPTVLQIATAPSDMIELFPAETSIGVAETRTFLEQIRLSPSAGNIRLGIIRSAEKLTPEAQNALLKTLEEPPPRVALVLETSNITSLLPTVLSRCHILRMDSRVTEQQTTISNPNILSLLTLGIGARLAACDSLGQTKQDVQIWMEQAQLDIHQALLAAYGITSSPNSPAVTPRHVARIGKKLLHAQEYLHVNVTPRLILDTIFMLQDERVDNQEFIV